MGKTVKEWEREQEMLEVVQLVEEEFVPPDLLDDRQYHIYQLAKRRRAKAEQEKHDRDIDRKFLPLLYAVILYLLGLHAAVVLLAIQVW